MTKRDVDFGKELNNWWAFTCDGFLLLKLKTTYVVILKVLWHLISFQLKWQVNKILKFLIIILFWWLYLNKSDCNLFFPLCDNLIWGHSSQWPFNWVFEFQSNWPIGHSTFSKSSFRLFCSLRLICLITLIGAFCKDFHESWALKMW